MPRKKDDSTKTRAEEEHEALIILTRVAELLRKQCLPQTVAGQKVPIKWAAKAAENIERYLNTPCPESKKDLDVESLDIAFGLKPGHGGAPRKDKEHIAIAREVLAMRVEGKSWLNIADTMCEKNCSVKDERELRRILKQFLATVVADDTRLDELLPDSDSGA